MIWLKLAGTFLTMITAIAALIALLSFGIAEILQPVLLDLDACLKTGETFLYCFAGGDDKP